MEAKRGRGRPPKSRDEKRSEIILLRMTTEERRLLESAAGENLSAWMRDLLLRAAKRKMK